VETVNGVDLVELGGVVLGLALLARIAGGTGISAVPLYLLAGLAFGEGGAAPLVTTEGFIELGGQIGLILLLFMLGLEHSSRELMVTMRRSMRVAVLDFVLNAIPGFVAGLLLGWDVVASLLLGGVTLVTSSGMAAKILQDLGWSLGSAGPLVVSVLVIEDLQMAVFLPIVAALVAEGTGLVGLGGAAIAVAVAALLLWLAMKVEVGISRALFSRSDEALVLTILGVAITIAGVGEMVGISAAVAALLVGIVLSGPAAAGARHLLRPLRDVFAAMFFVFIGFSVNPADLPPVLPAAFGLAALGAATKFATGWIGGGWRNLRRSERLRSAVALIPRGEFSLAIAGIGVASGIDRRLATLTVAYVLILGTVGPIAARIVDKRTKIDGT
jgi:monovalent cation:H+ antiporter-2, CPA2 family